MKSKLLQEVAILEDIKVNGEGLDPQILKEAVLLKESDYDEGMEGPDLILQMMKEGLL